MYSLGNRVSVRALFIIDRHWMNPCLFERNSKERARGPARVKTHRRSLGTGEVRDVTHGSLRMRVTEGPDDPEWDQFLAQVPGGHHVQTSLWAHVKAVSGWEAVRIQVTDAGQLVGGAQLFTRRLPLVGRIGYVPKGPVLAIPDPEVGARLVTEIMALSDSRGVRHLTIQPPNNGHAFSPLLAEHGFRPSAVPVAPPASLILDLDQDLDDLMAGLTAKTRYNVRLGKRKGLEVREGRFGDLPRYHDMLVSTGQRQNFEVYPRRYFEEMWKWLQPHGYMKLFLVTHGDEIVSGQVLIPFGDTVINKLSVWSGRFGSLRPNHFLQWHAIEWSKLNGYRYYDFEGLDPRIVDALHNDREVPESFQQSVATFKLGFGGTPVMFPPPQSSVSSSVVRFCYEVLFPKVSHVSFVKKLVGRFRVRRRRSDV